MQDLEIEIKVKIASNKPLLEFLKKNAEFQSEEKQVDEYFAPIKNSFVEVEPIKEWLRLREENNIYTLSYKKWHYDENDRSNHCDELETKIDDPDQGRKILKALKFKSLVTVSKSRKNYLYKNYQISLDSVKDLGDFVEIEYTGTEDKADPQEITVEMIGFLKNIGCEKIERYHVGYALLLLFPEKIRTEKY
ncbi:class IV adenylate cyclase [Patescibacteria group bacterium]